MYNNGIWVVFWIWNVEGLKKFRRGFFDGGWVCVGKGMLEKM